ncbi:MAG: hypothetical protein HYX20_03570 [Candidatus Yanofskybacteria bacterium]|nr:hypothetical protein [Candidatus Yanofskybacteria bacterium]
MVDRVKLYVFAIIIIAAIAVLLWRLRIRQQVIAPVVTPTPGGIGSDLYQKAENPGDKLPELNPLSNKPDTNPLSQTNPFKNVKTNPFK